MEVMSEAARSSLLLRQAPDEGVTLRRNMAGTVEKVLR